jgi:uncharacterized protein
MKIDVTDLLKSVGEIITVEKSEKMDFNDESLSLTSPIHVKLKLVNTGRTVLVTGTLNTTVKMNCSRCLKEFDQPISIKIEEEYAKKGAQNEKDEDLFSDEDGVELKEEDFVCEISEDNSIDLGEAIRQNIMVALPIKPLCTRNCKGLSVETAPKQKKIDPRLAKLKEFKLAGGN